MLTLTAKEDRVPRIHLVSRNPLHLTALDAAEFESGFWTLYETEAEKLINGMVYLHQKKSEPSFFGGVISGFRLAGGQEPYPGKIVFKVKAQDDCKNIPWEGDKHPMAWMGGILD